MFYGLQDIEIWRSIPTSGIANWGDPQWSYHHTEGEITVQPFSSSQMFRNNQMFADVISVFTCDVDADIQDGDELVFIKDGSYARVQVREKWDSGIMPHLEVYLSTSQWDRSLG
jgi:hypothetical protein